MGLHDGSAKGQVFSPTIQAFQNPLTQVVWHSWSRERLELRQNCASGLPNPARVALLLLFACVRGRLNKFAAEILGPLRKSNELENSELNIDESAPARFCEEFRSGVT